MKPRTLRDDVDGRVEVGPLDASGELDRHPRHDPVAALRPVQGDAGDPVAALVGERRQFHRADPTSGIRVEIRAPYADTDART
jgi:hypothetical protein